MSGSVRYLRWPVAMLLSVAITTAPSRGSGNDTHAELDCGDPICRCIHDPNSEVRYCLFWPDPPTTWTQPKIVTMACVRRR